jgi:hypothetical protein
MFYPQILESRPLIGPEGAISPRFDGCLPSKSEPLEQSKGAESGLKRGNFYCSRNFSSLFRLFALLEVTFTPRFDRFLHISKRERVSAGAC